MGTSPLTVFIESATGIREGGRTGLTACVTGICFFIALFFAPLLGKIHALKCSQSVASTLTAIMGDCLYEFDSML